MVTFDWYQATVRAHADDVLGALLGSSNRHALQHGRGVQGYGTCTKLLDEVGELGEVEVWHGGRQVHPHVRFTSDAAPGHVAILREAFPEHTVSRIDVKEDFGAEGAFDRMLPSLLDAAKRHRVKVDARGDHYVTKQGRTLQLGSRSSAVVLRVYDKAGQMRAKFAHDPVRLLTVPDHLTRYEVEVKPKDMIVRQACAKLEPAAFMGVSALVRETWQEFGGEPVSDLRVTRSWRPSEDERVRAYLVSTYGGLLSRWADELGSWDCLGLQLRDEVAAAVEAKRRLGG